MPLKGDGIPVDKIYTQKDLYGNDTYFKIKHEHKFKALQWKPYFIGECKKCGFKTFIKERVINKKW